MHGGGGGGAGAVLVQTQAQQVVGQRIGGAGLSTHTTYGSVTAAHGTITYSGSLLVCRRRWWLRISCWW